MKRFIILALLALAAVNANADEGMWMVHAIDSALEGAAWTADTPCPLGLLQGLQGPHLLLE